jgi:hypothetical protein
MLQYIVKLPHKKVVEHPCFYHFINIESNPKPQPNTIENTQRIIA